MSQLKIALITINFNHLDDTLDLLKSLSAASLPKDLSVTTYVIDNASIENPEAKIKEEYPEVVFIRNSDNLGFAAGNNIGIQKALEDGNDWIVLINNDCLVANDFFDVLIDSPLQEKTVGAIGGLIYFAPGFEFKDRYSSSDKGKVIWYGGGKLDRDNVLGSHAHVDEVDTGDLTAGHTDFISGALLATRADVLKKVGSFDPKYFMYLEDVDLCERIKDAGYQLIFYPKLKIWHKVAQSSAIGSSLNDYFITRNRLLFGMSHSPFRTRFALWREAARKIFTGTDAQKLAITDYLLGRLGKGSFIK